MEDIDASSMLLFRLGSKSNSGPPELVQGYQTRALSMKTSLASAPPW